MSDVHVAQLSEHKRPYDVSRSAEHKGVGDLKLLLTDPVFLCYNRPGVPCVIVVPAVLATWPLTQQSHLYIHMEEITPLHNPQVTVCVLCQRNKPVFKYSYINYVPHYMYINSFVYILTTLSNINLTLSTLFV